MALPENSTEVTKVDHISPTKVKLTISVSNAAAKICEQAVTKKLAQNAKIKGFRPGKVPMEMIKTRFKDEIAQELITTLLETGLAEAVEKAKVFPVTRPQIEIKKAPLSNGDDFEFDAEFEVRPEFELKRYKGVRVETPKIEIADEEVNKTLDRLREQFSVLEPVLAASPQKNQFAVIEMGIEIPDATPPKSEPPKMFTVEVGADKLLPELDNTLMAMKVGEKKKIEAVFPKDYSDPALAEKKGYFDCHLMELKAKKLPELNDEFAEQVKQGSTLLALRAEIRTDLEAHKKREAQEEQKNRIMEQLLDENPVEVPASLVAEQAKSIQRRALDDLKQHDPSASELPVEDMEEIQKRAESQVRSSMILQKVLEKENIKVNNAAVQGRVRQLSQQLNKTTEEAEKWLKDNGLWVRLQDDVLTEQVFDFLLKHADVVEVAKTAKS